MTAPRSESRELNGLRHHLLIWDAPAEAPTLVLLHGYLDLAWSFAPFAEALRRRLPVRLVAPDLRGHGSTEWVGRGGYYHFPDYVADVHALLATLPRPVWLLGHSMGGTVASLVTASFPDSVERLVLIEGLGPPPGTEPPPDRMSRWIHEVDERRQRPARPMPSLDVAQARLRESNPRLTPELSRLLAEKGTRAVPGGYVWAYDPLHRTRSPMPFSLEQFRTFLQRIHCPTLLVDASESAFGAFIEEDGRAGDLVTAQRVHIQEAGHMIHQDQPELLAEAVARFLSA
jgi:pimeloyl-ACP methyl ester carboxylesterase